MVSELKEKEAINRLQQSEIRYQIVKGLLVIAGIIITILFVNYKVDRAIGKLYDLNKTNSDNIGTALNNVQTKINKHDDATKTFVCNLMIQLKLIKQEQFDACFQGSLSLNASTQSSSPASTQSKTSLKSQNSNPQNTNSNTNQGQGVNNPPTAPPKEQSILPGDQQSLFGCIMLLGKVCI